MTKEDEFFARANAPMSAPDRLKGLMDAATKHRDFADFRRSLIEQLETTDTASAVGAFIADKIDETAESESLALEEVSAWATALLADQTLEDCRGFLANRDQFQQFVDRGRVLPDHPKSLSKLALLRSRLSGNRDAATALSPTR